MNTQEVEEIEKIVKERYCKSPTMQLGQIAEDLYKAGYRKIDGENYVGIDWHNEQIAHAEEEIERLKAEKAKVVREFAEELKEHINNLAIEKYGDIACDTSYLTIDIDEFCDDIDELLEEIESEEYEE